MIGKVVLDTNIFIDHLRAGSHQRWVSGQITGVVRILSSIVLLELRLGADTVQRGRLVDRIREAFPPHRIVAPSPDLYDRAGRLFRLIHGDGRGLANRLPSVNDILIALTAWRMGGRVVTSNADDFRAIADHLPGLRWDAP